MSLESEADDGETEDAVFAVHVLTRIYKKIDNAVYGVMSRTSQRQMLPRVEAPEKKCDAPKNMPEEFGWIIKDSITFIKT